MSEILDLAELRARVHASRGIAAPIAPPIEPDARPRVRPGFLLWLLATLALAAIGAWHVLRWLTLAAAALARSWGL